MKRHEIDQAIFDKMDQSPYTIHVKVNSLKHLDMYDGNHLINITAHHNNSPEPIGGLSFMLPSGDMGGMEIHPDHRNGIVAAKMIEKAYTVSHRLGFNLSKLQPQGQFSPDSSKILDKLFPKEDGSKYPAVLRKGFTFGRIGRSMAYGSNWDESWDGKKCPACFGSHRLGLESEDMKNPVKVAQGYKECPHCDELGHWNGTDKE